MTSKKFVRATKYLYALVLKTILLVKLLVQPGIPHARISTARRKFSQKGQPLPRDDSQPTKSTYDAQPYLKYVSLRRPKLETQQYQRKTLASPLNPPVQPPYHIYTSHVAFRTRRRLQPQPLRERRGVLRRPRWWTCVLVPVRLRRHDLPDQHIM